MTYGVAIDGRFDFGGGGHVGVAAENQAPQCGADRAQWVVYSGDS